MSTLMTHYELELEPDQKRVFVTQLREDEDEDDKKLNIRKIPIVRERAGRLVEMGFNTLQKTLLLKREVEANSLDQVFLEKKQNFKMRMNKCELQDEKLKSKEKALKERMEKFRKFITENDVKRKRAMVKFQQERKLKLKKQGELEMLEKELNALILKTEKLKDKLRKYVVFEKYLCKVIDVLPENYIEATDNMLTALMMRYQTLQETNMLLSNKRIDLQSQGMTVIQFSIEEDCSVILVLELHVQEYQGLALQQSQKLLICNQELAVSQDTLEKLIQRNAKLEVLVSIGQQKYMHNSVTRAQIMLAIENLYNQCDQRNVATSFSQKLDLVNAHLKDREAVYHMSRPVDANSEKAAAKRRHGKTYKSVVQIKTSVSKQQK